MVGYDGCRRPRVRVYVDIAGWANGVRERGDVETVVMVSMATGAGGVAHEGPRRAGADAVAVRERAVTRWYEAVDGIDVVWGMIR